MKQLEDIKQARLSRRQLLKLAGAAAVSSVVAACAPTAAPQPAPAAPTQVPAAAATQAPAPTAAQTAAPAVKKPVEIVFSWWGEDEAPGLRKWVQESVTLFQKANPGITIQAVEQTTDAVIPAFQAAQQARSGMDCMYHWSNPPFLVGIWQGAMAPLDDLMADDLKHIPTRISKWATSEGKVRSIPFYTVAFWNVYNKEIYKKAGVDPAKPPKTFDQWIEAGKAVKKAGFIPYALGIKDQWSMEWVWNMWAQSNCTSTYEFFECWLGLNGKSMKDPAVAGVWAAQKAIIDNKLLPDDVQSIGLYEGMDYFKQGKAASVTSIQTLIKTWSRSMGDNIGHFFGDNTFGPPWGDKGKMTNDVAFGSQWLTILEWSQHKEEAAKWLSFLRTQDRMQSLYKGSSAVILDDRFDPAWLDNPYERDLMKLCLNGQLWVPGYIAPSVHPDMAHQNFLGLYNGTMTVDQAAENAERIMAGFRTDQPELAASYTKWAENFKPAA